MQTIKQSILTLIICMAVVAGVSAVFAWTGAPPSGPPNDNTPTPINIGATQQIKSGPLQVNGFRNLGTTILDGNVGIGTTGPKFPLDVVKAGTGITGTLVGSLEVMQDATNKRGVILGYDTSGQIGTITANSAGPNNSQLAFWTWTNNSGWSERVRIDNAGNVGIGTPDPRAKLEVNGNVYAGSGESHFWYGTYSDPHENVPYAIKVAGSGGVGSIAASGNAVFMNGNVGIGTTGPKSLLHIKSDSPSVNAMINLESDLGIVNQIYTGRSAGGAPGHLVIEPATGKNTIINNGNVGIGTTVDPGTNKLQVNGKIQAIGGDICTDQGGGKCLSASGGGVGGSYEIVTKTCGAPGAGVFNCSATCPSGKVVLGGGCRRTENRVIESYPSSSTTWYCLTDYAIVTAYAICAY